MKKERWTEVELLTLPAGEHDYFERKGGDLLSDSGHREKIAQALSAFANSGGGHLIIGVKNDLTIDGIPEMLGRTPIRDWFEQFIPNLLNYPLQDFRVHEVERDAQSTIFSGRVVVIIDVGDSALAPHQSESNKVYYHRAGGRSEPAPHHYLRLLWGREAYPSQRIAYAWLSFVVAPWLRQLATERDHLRTSHIGWDRFTSKAKNIVCFAPFSALETQCVESYSEIASAIQEHDSGSRSLLERIQALDRFIQSSGLLADRYARATSNESIKEIRRRFSHLDASYGPANYLMITGSFGTMSREQQFAFLTELIVNQKGDLDSSFQAWPVWNTYGETFREILNIPPVAHEWNGVKDAIQSQLDRITVLIGLIESTRHELAFKFGEPYEDKSLSPRFRET